MPPHDIGQLSDYFTDLYIDNDSNQLVTTGERFPIHGVSRTRTASNTNLNSGETITIGSRWDWDLVGVGWEVDEEDIKSVKENIINRLRHESEATPDFNDIDELLSAK